ncbi:MAG: hypothetical protein AAFR50_09660 [Pseudomonadota bacterium]
MKLKTTESKARSLSTSALALAAVPVALFAPALFGISERGTSDEETSLRADALPASGPFISPVSGDADTGDYEITGVLHLVKASAEVSEFILVSDSGFCPWCGGLDHGTALEVQLAGPALGLEHGARVTVRGQLEEVAGLDAHLTARIVGATIL